jgi:branched-chain amino acid transport system ATP-binding protein
MGEGAAILDLRGLVKRYAGLTATDLSLEVRVGEIHAVIGPNGAGKTTLVGQISGALAPDQGRVFFDGHDVTHLPMHARVARGLARSYQITNVFRRQTVLDNLALAVQARSGTSMRFWRPALEERALFDEARAFAERVGLGERTGVRAGELAHGEQRQLEVGLALATLPKLLLLDEPLAGMGADASALLPLLGSLRRDATVLLVEHDMDAVFQLADRITVLVSGRVLATGLPDEIRRSPEVQQAYLGDEGAP